jgi:hypothetical protein
MRLTLRNLLRFLDQTSLRSPERQRLQELVDQSETADAWIRRIRQLRLSHDTGVPPVESREPLLDEVAGWLDGITNEPASVAFEKSMLASDERLAEVACCHAILEDLQSGPDAGVPILLRQSIYDLGRSGRSTATGSDTEDPALPAMAASMQDLPYVDRQPDESHPTIDLPVSGDATDHSESMETLFGQGNRRKLIVLAALVIFLAAMFTLSFQLGRQSSLFSRKGRSAGQAQSAGQDPDDSGEVQAAGTGLESQTDAVTDSGSTPEERVEEGPPPDPSLPAAAIKTESAAPGQEPAVTKVVEAQTGTATAEDETIDFAGMYPLAGLSANEPPAAGEAAGELPPPPSLFQELVADSDVPPEPLPVATLSGPQAMLLRWQQTPAGWVRAHADAPLRENTELMVLAGTSVDLDFRGHLQVRIEGPARVTLGSQDVASGADVLVVDYGRFTVTSSVADMDLLWQRQNRRYRLTLPVSQASVTAGFSNYLPFGDDPRSSGPARIDLFVTGLERARLVEGEIEWRLPAGMAMVRCDGPRPELVRPVVTGRLAMSPEQPRNYEVRLRETVDRYLEDLPELLRPGVPVADLLVDMKSDRRQERRFVALSWLAAVGDYTYLVDYLNDDENRNHWRSVIEAVRASLRNQPGNADALYDGLAVAGSEARDALYQLFVGFGPSELDSRGEQLVKWLDDEALCVRVLAIERLRQITGGLAYGYNPLADRKDRRRIIDRQWKKLLDENNLRYKEPPVLPLPAFTEAGAIEPSGEAPPPANPDTGGEPGGRP